jgi:hypothetical protein
MIFSISILKLNALAMWAPKTAFNEELVLSRLIAFAFSHGLDPKETGLQSDGKRIPDPMATLQAT